MAGPNLTPTQRFMLVCIANDWTVRAMRLATHDNDVHQAFLDAHVLALSLAHLERCLEHLQGTSREVDEARDAFVAAMKSASLRDMRNALEHEEEYIAGEGRHPGLVCEPDTWPVDEEGSWSTVLMSLDDRLEEVRVLGKAYALSGALDALLAIKAALDAEWTKFTGRPPGP